jgi:large subunit ribosomal protein L7/L12
LQAATQNQEELKKMVEKKKLTKDQIIDSIGNLTVLELSELVKSIEEKFDVKAAPAVGVAAAAPQAGAAGEGESGAEEKTQFNVVLEGLSDDSKKITVIKVVREITGLGLKESKELVEGAPKPVKENVPKAEAEELQKKLSQAGAKAALK